MLTGPITRRGLLGIGPKAPQSFRARGLGHVRIRLREAPTPTLLRHLDKVVADSLAAGLVPVLAYQADAFKDDPTDANLQGMVTWWTTLARRYAKASPKVSFNLIVEVTDALNNNQAQLNKVYEKTVAAIRVTNPRRTIFISPRVRSDPALLGDLAIPSKANGYLAAEWHFYAAGPSKTNAKKLWTTGSPEERQLLLDKFDAAGSWSNRPVSDVGRRWMAGNYNEGDDYTPAEQVVFATYVACELDRRQIPYAVNSDTKFFDREQHVWIEPMAPVLEAIIRPKCS